MTQPIKSAEPLSDPEQIVARINEMAHPHTRASVGDDGHVRMQKPGHMAKAEAPSEELLRKLVVARGMEWRDVYRDRTLAYWASDERVDGHGDIVRQSWVFDEFERNSPMPVSHDWVAPPVGRVIEWRTMMRAEPDYTGKALWLRGLFAPAEDYDWADTVFRLARAGILVAGSVGFWSAKVLDVKDPAERQALGLGRYGLVFEDNHLLEFSPCTIPANPGATVAGLQRAKSQGLLQPHDLYLVRELRRRDLRRARPKDELEQWYAAEHALIETGRAMFPTEAFEVHRDLDMPVTLNHPPVSRTTGSGVGVDLSSLSTQIGDLQSTVASIGSQLASVAARVETVCDALEAARESQPPGADTGGDAGNAKDGAGNAPLNTELAALTRRLEALAQPG